MEQLFEFAGRTVLLTTAGDRRECQRPDWWDQAQVIVRIDFRSVLVLRGGLDATLAGIQ